MVITENIDKTKDVVRPVIIERIYGKEPHIFAVPELEGMAKKLLVLDDPTSDGALAFIWRECKEYLDSIGYADDRFRGRRNIIFEKKTVCGELRDPADCTGKKNLTTVEVGGKECFATIIGGSIVSAAAAYMVGEAYEICAETAIGYRGCGYACENVTALSDMLVSRGENVRYLCGEANEISKKVALSAGFYEAGKRYEYIVRRKG